MVKIEFSNKKMEVKITGHANYEEKGKDIVCAAVSALFYTLAESVERSREMLKTEPKIELDDGNGKVSCRPKKAYETNVSLVYWTVLNGFEILATEYPENVEFIVKG